MSIAVTELYFLINRLNPKIRITSAIDCHTLIAGTPKTGTKTNPHDQ